MNVQSPISYEGALRKINTGDIVFLSGAKGLFSRAITKVTKSPFSHVGIAVWLTDCTCSNRAPLPFIVEAFSAGRRIVSLSYYGESRSLSVIESPIPWEKYSDELMQRTGREPYGWLDLLGLGLKELVGLKGLDFNGEVCSEMVAKSLNRGGLGLDPMQSPGSLYTDLLSRGFALKAVTDPKIEDEPYTWSNHDHPYPNEL